MYEEEQDDDDVISQLTQLVSKPKKVLHKEDFVPVKKNPRKVQKEAVERQRPKKINNNIAY